jgi:hypothetical protein
MNIWTQLSEGSLIVLMAASSWGELPAQPPCGLCPRPRPLIECALRPRPDRSAASANHGLAGRGGLELVLALARMALSIHWQFVSPRISLSLCSSYSRGYLSISLALDYAKGYQKLRRLQCKPLRKPTPFRIRPTVPFHHRKMINTMPSTTTATLMFDHYLTTTSTTITYMPARNFYNSSLRHF